MACQRCKSERVLSTNSHGRDCQDYSIGDLVDHQGYAPRIPGICGGDALFPDICLDCGQCQGEFPKGPVKIGDGEIDY